MCVFFNCYWKKWHCLIHLITCHRGGISVKFEWSEKKLTLFHFLCRIRHSLPPSKPLCLSVCPPIFLSACLSAPPPPPLSISLHPLCLFCPSSPICRPSSPVHARARACVCAHAPAYLCSHVVVCAPAGTHTQYAGSVTRALVYVPTYGW